MARINVEEKWWSDPRRTKLSQLLGNPYFTETVVVHAWRLAQEYWEKGQLIPGHIYLTLFGAKELLEAALATVHIQDNALLITSTNIQQNTNTIQHHSNGVQQDPTSAQQVYLLVQQGYIYMRGSREFLSWGYENRQKRSLAGQKSAKRPRDEKGRLLKLSTNIQQNTNKPNYSGSGSGSSSGSKTRSRSKKKKLPFDEVYPPEFEALFILYEEWGDKIEAYQMFQEQKLSLQESKLMDLKMAIGNYIAENPNIKYRKRFENFLNMDWRVYLKPRLIQKPLSFAEEKTQERVSTFNDWKEKKAQQGSFDGSEN